MKTKLLFYLILLIGLNASSQINLVDDNYYLNKCDSNLDVLGNVLINDSIDGNNFITSDYIVSANSIYYYGTTLDVPFITLDSSGNILNSNIYFLGSIVITYSVTNINTGDFSTAVAQCNIDPPTTLAIDDNYTFNIGSDNQPFSIFFNDQFCGSSPLNTNFIQINILSTLPNGVDIGLYGKLNIDSSTLPGIYTILYEISNLDPAGEFAWSRATLTLTVTADCIDTIIPTFTQITPICTLTTTSPLPTTSTNGITGTWSPAFNNATPPFTITTTTYTFTPDAGQCATTTTMDIQVYPLQDILFMPIEPICSGDTLIPPPNTSLNGITGTWSPPFNNTTTTTYTFTPDSGYCAVPRTLTITVNPVTPTFTAVTPICSGDVLAPLPTTSLNGLTGTWSPALNNTTTTTYTFTPAVGSLCAISTTLTIVVNPLVTPIFDPIEPFCISDFWSLWPVFENTSLNGITGTWSPALDIWYPTSGTYTFTPNPGQCATTTTLDLVINPWVFTTFTPVAPICIGETLAPLPTTSLEGITGTWSPALNSTATTTYTFSPDAGQCAIGTTMVITVNFTPIPIVNKLLVTVDGPCVHGSGIYNPILIDPYAGTGYFSYYEGYYSIEFNGFNWVIKSWHTHFAGGSLFENPTAPASLYPPTTGWIASLPTIDDGCAPGTVTIDLLPMNTAFCDGDTVANLKAVGTDLKWYSVASGGTALASTTLLATGSYYVTQTVSGCESERVLVNIIVNPIVTPTFTPIAPICSGAPISPLPPTSLNGITGTWSPALNNTTTTTYTFTPDAGQCASTTTMTINVMPGTLWYADADADGFGNPLVSIMSCTMPTGYVSNNSDCVDSNPLINPSAIEICCDGIDNNCNGLIDEGCGLTTLVTSKIRTIQCGTTLAAINSTIVADIPSLPVTGYKFRVIKMTGGFPSIIPADTQIFNSTSFFPNTFNITQLPLYAYNTTYQIEVSVLYLGVWQCFGIPCLVTTPNANTKVRASQCNTTLTYMNEFIYADNVSYADGYRFTVVNLTDPTNILPTQENASGLRILRMDLFSSPNALYGCIYEVRVELKNHDGTYTNYGPMCTITTPSIPTTKIRTIQCGTVVPSTTTQVRADLVTGATNYRFRLSASPSFSAVWTNPVIGAMGGFCTLSNFAPTGLPAGTIYNIEVAVSMDNGINYGAYGPICTISTGTAFRPLTSTAKTINLDKEFNAVAFPNPYKNEFNIQLDSNTDTQVSIAMYDMIGKLVYNKTIPFNEVNNTSFGTDLPAGVYQVIVSQNEETKVLRLIKN